MSPKVSVIVPNYNHCFYLTKRIDSILQQTFQDFEVIILDDNSSDESRQVIEMYRQYDKISSIIFNEINQGTFEQWKKGIDQAKGEWIWIAESDDWCEPTLLENLMEGVDENCTLAFAQSLLVYEDGTTPWNSRHQYLADIVNGNDFIKDHMLLTNGIANASMCIFKKKCYYQVDKAFTEYKLSGDWLFWVQIAMQGNIFISGKILNYFRKHSNDVSGPAYKNGLFYIEFFKVMDNFERAGIITNYRKLALIKTKFSLFLNDFRMDTVAREKVLKIFELSLGSNKYKVVIRHTLLRSLRVIKNAVKVVWPMESK